MPASALAYKLRLFRWTKYEVTMALMLLRPTFCIDINTYSDWKWKIM